MNPWPKPEKSPWVLFDSLTGDPGSTALPLFTIPVTSRTTLLLSFSHTLRSSSSLPAPPICIKWSTRSYREILLLNDEGGEKGDCLHTQVIFISPSVSRINLRWKMFPAAAGRPVGNICVLLLCFPPHSSPQRNGVFLKFICKVLFSALITL